MTIQEKDELLALFLDFSEALFHSGAEIERVEDSVMYLASSFGAKRTDIFAITSIVLLTVDFGDGQPHSCTRRITNAAANDFVRLSRLNALCRDACREPMPITLFRERMNKICEIKPSRTLLYLSAGFAASAFALFFGGSPLDSVFAFFIGILTTLVQRAVSPFFPNRLFLQFIVSFLSGTMIVLSSRLVPPLSSDHVIIGVIMLLVPGIAITTAPRDLILGSTITGSLKILESLLLAVTMALGFIAAMALLGRS